MNNMIAIKWMLALSLQFSLLGIAQAQSSIMAQGQNKIQGLPGEVKPRFSQKVLIDAKIGADARSSALIDKLIAENPQIEAMRITAKNGKSIFILRSGMKIQLSDEMRTLISIDSGGWQPEELSGQGFGKKAIANLISEISRTSQCSSTSIRNAIAKVDCQSDMLVLTDDLGEDASQCLDQ